MSELKVGEVKDGRKTSENKLAWAGLILSVLVTVGPALLKVVPPDSVAAVIIGCLVAVVSVVAAYFGKRGWVKANAATNKAILEAASLRGGAPPNP
jgi:uncharacterized membrane protein